MTQPPETGNAGTGFQRKGNRPPLWRIVAFAVLGFMLLCAGLWALVFFEAGIFANQDGPNLTATALAANNQACQQLVERAMQESDTYCKNIGTNQLCYGNFSVEAELAEGVAGRFAQRGDVIDVDDLRRLSAAPLDVAKQAWGIAIFKVMANLPRSLPGQTVTLLVFGNTTLDKEGPGLQTFYFFSDTGQVICDAVPFDGLLITMPDGVGATFNINGSELVLTGTASITAAQGEGMNISLYSGSAQVTADGETQVFGPGEQVSIPLGGENGLDPVGPPSEPSPISEDELVLSCTMTGENCDLTPIPTVPAEDIEATLAVEMEPTLGATQASPSPAASKTVTALPSPTRLPSATFLPPIPTRAATATKKPNPSATSGPSLTPSRTFTPSLTRTSTPTFTPSLTRTFTPTFTPSLTHTPTPTVTASLTPTATLTASQTPTPTPTHTPTPTGSSTFTPTFTSTFTPTFTATASNTFTPTFTPTNTATFTPTNTNTPTSTPICNISMSAISFSGSQLSVQITNNSGEQVRLTQLIAFWIDPLPDELQSVTSITLNSSTIWTGSELDTPSTHTFSGAPGLRQIGNAETKTLIMNFTQPLAAGLYELQPLTFDTGCTVSQSGSRP